MRFSLLPLVCILAASVAWGENNFFNPGIRSAHQGEIIYLLMPDRFNHADPTRNQAQPDSGEPAQSGFDPANPRCYHGGDLRGIDAKLNYLNHLGVSSIWMTPIFRNRAVQEAEGRVPLKTGYHGYWILDFTDVDPHFGSKQLLRQLISDSAAHGIGIILDIVVNHTADVIQPKNGVHAYQYKFSKPYLDANGQPFDDRSYINKPDFPKLDPSISFPVPPAFNDEADRTIKKPDWLNDPTVYHNRGDASGSGESDQYGDIAGLDDLFTEQPRVVQGMIDIYSDWVRHFAIAGFRLDTVKHVNDEFWQRFVPAMQDVAAEAGRKNFFIFGEVYNPDPAVLSEFVHRAGIPAVLDFGFQRAAAGFASGIDAPRKLAEFFAKDGYYTTPSANAYGLVTFLSNHDIGRIGHFLVNDLSTAPDEELLARDVLAHALLFFTRGIPCLYYGDEQGFTGRGGDALAREDMFGSKVPDFAGEKRIGGGDGAAPAFNEDHPLFRAIREMISVRRKHPALESGIQIVRCADDRPGIFAVSRIDRGQRKEVVAAFNNSGETHKTVIKTSSPSGGWERVYAGAPAGTNFAARPDNQLYIELGPWSVLVLGNAETIDTGPKQPGELHLEATRNGDLEDHWEIKAEFVPDQIASVAFGVRAKGEADYKFLGTADTAPYRVFPAWDVIPNTPELEFKAIAHDLSGNELTAEFEWRRRVPRGSGR
ncbi:MAG: alpha-amylase [Verrucomicrobia bacterium]|nr:alpha-amylase [Verrucomicrobiota bacterium]